MVTVARSSSNNSAAVLLLLLATSSSLALAAGTTARPRPNILFLFADEMDGRIFDPESPQLKPPMPNLHKLAAGGAIFTVAYNQSPQCVPSRSALLVGLRTDQIEVWDNYHGIASTNGDPSSPDPHCAQQIARASNKSAAQAHEYCVALAKAQHAPPTFIDRLGSAGYRVELFGKMHAGAGLDRFPGQIGEFPFSWLGSSREWTRGLGPSLNLKGVNTADNSQTKWVVPDNVTLPASKQDYSAIDGCVSALDGGLFLRHHPQPAFLYCSILPPHPIQPVSCPECGTTYPTNATYMAAVASLDVQVPEQVPWEELHPNDRAAVVLKRSTHYDSVPREHIIHFRRVYFSMCFEADSLLGKVIDALDKAGGGAVRQNSYVLMISDHGEDNIEHRKPCMPEIDHRFELNPCAQVSPAKTICMTVPAVWP